MDPLLALRQTLRRLSHRPGWTSLVVVTLALGIGATVATFSVVDALLLRPLPYPDPQRLVLLRESSPISPMVPLTAAEVAHLRSATRTLGALEALDPISFHLASAEGAERVPGALVSPGFFTMLGATAVAGRLLEAEDARSGGGGAQPVVLSHTYWRTRFGAEPAVIGEELRLSWTAPFGPRRRLGETFVVVGVLSSEFRSPYGAADLWAPLVPPDPPAYEEANYLFGFGRLRAGVGLGEARAELGALLQGLGAEGLPRTTVPVDEMGVTVLPLSEQGVASVRPALWIVFAAVALVMLVACANAANLLLLRRDERRGEMAVRSALGASRARLAAEMALDGAVLAIGGGAAGLAAAWTAVRWFRGMRPGLLPREQDVLVDGRVALFAAALAAVTVALVAVVPAFLGSGSAPEGSRGVARGDGSSRSRVLLVSLELALAMLLLVGAGLLTRSFGTLARTDPGFTIERLLTFELALPAARYPEPAQRAEFLRSALERLRALPGVKAAAVASGLPLTPVNTASAVTVSGGAPVDGQPRAVTFRLVGDGYFEALGIPVLEGRPFSASEIVSIPGEARVVAINRSFADRFFPDSEPSTLGSSVRLHAFDTPDLLVVAVVGDVREFGPASAPRPTVYLPVASSSSSGFALRADGEGGADPRSLFDDVRGVLAQLDPAQPAHGFRTFDSVAERWLGTPAFQSSLMSVFAALALALAAVGVFGAVGYAMRRRTREIGLRRALGARPLQIARALLGEVGVFLAGGATAGALGAVALSRFLRGSLHGVEPDDPATYGVALALIGGAVVVAVALPLRRAFRIDPLEALRDS